MPAPVEVEQPQPPPRPPAVHQPQPPSPPVVAPQPAVLPPAPLPPAPEASHPVPPQQAAPQSWGPTRMELIEKLFGILDTKKEGRLTLRCLRAYAALCGFNDTEEQWAREYDALCTLYGWNAEEGADVQNFAQLIDDEEGAAYCTDEELVSVLDEVDQCGVPLIFSAEAPSSPSGAASRGSDQPASAVASPASSVAAGGAPDETTSQSSQVSKSRSRITGMLQSVPGFRSKPAAPAVTPKKSKDTE